MILPAVRDPRLVSIPRGGLLADADHQLLALWAATCAEHVLKLFEKSNRADDRSRTAIEAVRAWVRLAASADPRPPAFPCPRGPKPQEQHLLVRFRRLSTAYERLLTHPSASTSIDVGSTAGDSEAGDALDHDGIQVKDHPEGVNPGLEWSDLVAVAGNVHQCRTCQERHEEKGALDNDRVDEVIGSYGEPASDRETDTEHQTRRSRARLSARHCHHITRIPRRD